MKITRFKDGFRAIVPCKVNLALKVLGRRSDGFHELETIMMAVGLCDELTFRPDVSGELRLKLAFQDGKPLASDDPAWEVPCDTNNLVIRALEDIARELDRKNLGGDILLVKSIPSMAGLGGGSADAAAAIVLGALGCLGDRFSGQITFRMPTDRGQTGKRHKLFPGGTHAKRQLVSALPRTGRANHPHRCEFGLLVGTGSPPYWLFNKRGLLQATD